MVQKQKKEREKNRSVAFANLRALKSTWFSCDNKCFLTLFSCQVIWIHFKLKSRVLV